MISQRQRRYHSCNQLAFCLDLPRVLQDIMEMVAPAGPMYQAGTLSGNPLAMTAGIETLKRLKARGTRGSEGKRAASLCDVAAWS